MRNSLLTALILAVGAVAPAQVSSLVVNEFMASNTTILVDGDGEYSDWIEIYNPTAGAVSLTGCYLSDDATNLPKWVFPASAAISVPANGYLVVFASGKGTAATPHVDTLGYVHTSFKLSAGGESVLLVNTDGTSIVSSIVDFPTQPEDISYGIGANSTTGFLQTPTPGAANTNAGGGWVEDTNFSVGRGFYTAPFQVEITTATADATIRYTLDGSTPSETIGTVYTVPIPVSASTVLRAMAYKDGFFSTNVDTQTYLFVATAIAQPATKPSAAWPDPYHPTGGGGGGGGAQAIDYGMDTRITQGATYAALMDDALLAIPTFSLVTDLPNLFNTTTGIYMNAGGEGETWERPASVELIHPDGTPGFQADGGIRIRGGVSAGSSNPKHSFRLIMKSDYGDSKINYPLFGADGPQTFDKIDFRTAQNFSWNLSSPANATWLDDPFSRDTMRDMGHPSTRGFFFHLYINGIYWGLYQTEERPDGYYCETNIGGTEDQWDVVKSDEDTGAMYATEGTTDYYYAFWTQVNAGVTTAAAYYQLQGKNTDRTVNLAYKKYLDRDNLIDYMLLVFFTGAQDMPLGPPNSNSQPRNLYAVGNRVTPTGFMYLPHDNEWSLVRNSGVGVNRVTATLGSALGTQVNFNPWWLHSRLKTNAEYALDFADRVHKHLYNNGAMTPAACTTRYQARMDEISTAIIAESARWGDYLNSTTPYTKASWTTATSWVKDSFFNATPQTRTTIVIGQLRSAGLYPSIDAPEFNQHGGQVTSGFQLAITGASTIYYTTDGSDPRLVGGAVAGTATAGTSLTLTQPSTVKARVRSGSTWSALTEAVFTISDVATATPTATPTATATATASPTASATATPSPTATGTATPSPTISLTPTLTPTLTATATPTAVPTATPVVNGVGWMAY